MDIFKLTVLEKHYFSLADEIEEDLDGVLPSGDDMACGEKLRGSVLKSAFEGMLV